MAQDQDQEVKDCAISCMAAAVSQLGDVITPQVPQVLQVTQNFWSCRPQPLMGLQPRHPYPLLHFVAMLRRLLFAAPHSTCHLRSKHSTSFRNWRPAV